jgi:Raf kinase inhibitor-like YbhB/YbcL family protein
LDRLPDFYKHSKGLAQLKLTSTVFGNGQYIPVEYSADGSGISPSLQWDCIPSGTLSFAMVMTDLDIPSPTKRWAKFFHWVVYNIPANKTSLPVNFSVQESDRGGEVIAPNSASRRSYYPPCPVSGTHEYVFKLFALDDVKIFPAGERLEQVLQEINSHTLLTSELVGLYKCSKFTGWQALLWNCGHGHQKR